MMLELVLWSSALALTPLLLLALSRIGFLISEICDEIGFHASQPFFEIEDGQSRCSLKPDAATSSVSVTNLAVRR